MGVGKSGDQDTGGKKTGVLENQYEPIAGFEKLWVW